MAGALFSCAGWRKREEGEEKESKQRGNTKKEGERGGRRERYGTQGWVAPGISYTHTCTSQLQPVTVAGLCVHTASANVHISASTCHRCWVVRTYGFCHSIDRPETKHEIVTEPPLEGVLMVSSGSQLSMPTSYLCETAATELLLLLRGGWPVTVLVSWHVAVTYTRCEI